jgi:RNA polymerase sigma factor (sigma-70 family)
MTDAMLIKDYAETGSRPAMDELVLRHADWVYSAAARMVGDADLAEDVTQAAFLILIQKAQRLRSKPVNAWLFNVTRYAAKHALRARSRRTRHERLAAIRKSEIAPLPVQNIWQDIEPLLDELVERLNRNDRQAILLRFYQRKSMADVGSVLGISEDAAKKRVGKAVRRLRDLFAGRGLSVPTIAFAGAIELNTTHSAPAACTRLPVKPAIGATSISTGALTMMWIARMKLAVASVLLAGVIPAAVIFAVQADSGNPPADPNALAQTDPASDQNAADLYMQANAAVKVDSPASTSMDFPEAYSPWSADWQKVAAAAWNADGEARRLAHLAASIPRAHFASTVKDEIWQLNAMRNLANTIGDAALYAHFLGHDTEAINEIGDLLHISDLLAASPGGGPTVQRLVGIGIEALTMSRLNQISVNVVLTNDPANHNALQIAAARELIRRLINERRWAIRSYWSELPDKIATTQPAKFDRIMIASRRVDGERLSAAIILACHIYQFEKGSWPTSLSDLFPDDLPHALIDPAGDGKQTIGYVLIRHGLPNGSDRPLVFYRDNIRDGIFFRLDEPEFSFYEGDGSHRPVADQKQGGEFRDVTLWKPPEHLSGPTTQALPLSAQLPAPTPPAGNE